MVALNYSNEIPEMLEDGFEYGIQSLFAKDGTVKLTSWHESRAEAEALLALLRFTFPKYEGTDVGSARMVRRPVGDIEIVKEA